MIKLSYLVSTYDSGAYLDSHIADLIEKQTDPDFEIVIVNPNSPGTDGLIAEKWAAQDPRVNYIFHPVRESYGSSWLRAWKAAKGNFVVNSNTDDFHMPSFTEDFYKHMTAVKLTQDNPIAFGYAGMVVVDESGNQKGAGCKPDFDFEVMSRECWAGAQVCWLNSSSFKEKLDWPLMETRAEEYKSAFDYWLWLYFMSLGYHGISIPKILTVYTQREDSIENSNKWANNYETYSAISEFFSFNFGGHLKHAKEFKNFNERPPKDEWISRMQRGKKWK